MYCFGICIAGHNIEINCNYSYLVSQCSCFLAEFDNPEIIISCSDNEIIDEHEYLPSYRLGKIEGSISYYDKGMVESAIVLRKLSEALLKYDVILFHGAAISLQGKCIIFSAPSGTGKTTHINKWLNCVPNTRVVNGDKPFISITDSDSTVFGSPWAGKENMYSNTKASLQSIVFIERSEENHIEPIPLSLAFRHLLQQTYWPKDIALKKKTLSLLHKLAINTAFYHFSCNNYKDNCLEIAYSALCPTV